MLEYSYEKRKDNMFMMEVFEYPFWVVILGEAGLASFIVGKFCILSTPILNMVDIKYKKHTKLIIYFFPLIKIY